MNSNLKSTTVLVSFWAATLALCACQRPPAAEQIPDCGKSGCHDISKLNRAVSSAPPREHTLKLGEGLVRKVVLIPSGQKTFRLIWPRRGHHPAESTRGKCLTCHPVSAEGIRHGISQYPASARKLAFAAGKSCARASCHPWLGTAASSSGFKPAKGATPVYKGSLRPHDLLTAAKDGHGKIYRQGYVKASGPKILVGRLQPGCVSCHGTRNDKHGSMAGCMDCHSFGGMTGDLHQTHTRAIKTGRALIDPGNAKESGCNYCHQLEKPTRLKNAACFNCHLSGHQVMDPKTGEPHFWSL